MMGYQTQEGPCGGKVRILAAINAVVLVIGLTTVASFFTGCCGSAQDLFEGGEGRAETGKALPNKAPEKAPPGKAGPPPPPPPPPPLPPTGEAPNQGPPPPPSPAPLCQQGQPNCLPPMPQPGQGQQQFAAQWYGGFHCTGTPEFCSQRFGTEGGPEGSCTGPNCGKGQKARPVTPRGRGGKGKAKTKVLQQEVAKVTPAPPPPAASEPPPQTVVETPEAPAKAVACQNGSKVGPPVVSLSRAGTTITWNDPNGFYPYIVQAGPPGSPCPPRAVKGKRSGNSWQASLTASQECRWYNFVSTNDFSSGEVCWSSVPRGSKTYRGQPVEVDVKRGAAAFALPRTKLAAR